MFKLKIINKPKMIKMKCNIEFPDVVLANWQDKETTPTKETQVIVADFPFDGLSKVTVNPIPDEYIIPDGNLEINQNGTYDVTNYANANVNVPEKQLGTKTITSNGTYKAVDDNLDGYNQVDVQTSGVDINEYFETTYSGTLSNNWALYGNYIKKCPNLVISDNVTSIYNLLGNVPFAPKIICNSNVTDMSYLYNSNRSKSIDVSGLNTSNVTNMQQMFYNCSSLRNLSLSNFDTSNVTNMENMFRGCSSLTELDLSKWNTSKVKTMNSMFSSCSSLTNLNVSNFDTSNVEDYGINALFSGCRKLVNLDLSKWNTSKAKSMNFLFENCSSLTSLDVSNFDTSNVIGMNTVFSGCSSLTSLDLSSFNTSNATSMRQMFNNCSKLTQLDIRNFDFTNVTTYTDMFSNVPTDCLIIVKDDTAKTWITEKFTTLTNVKTVAELGEKSIITNKGWTISQVN